jgi:hypothetical protein
VSVQQFVYSPHTTGSPRVARLRTPQVRASPREISLVTTRSSIRTLVVAALLVSSAIAALSFAGSASAATKCGEKVLADWYDNGRIDRLYPLNCYEEAIDAIPEDIGPYVDAEDVITRALQGALRGNLSQGGCDPSADGSPDDCANQPGGGNGGNGGNSGGNGSGDSTDGGQQAAPDVDTSAPSSVPIPLLVLGGMSLLLLAAGGLGYLSRRRQAAHADDAGDHDPFA